MNFGRKVAKFIETQWFWKDKGTTSSFLSRKRRWDELRAYSLGNQSVYRYQDRFKQDGDLSYVNLDWEIIPIIPKIVDLVSNGIQNRLFAVKS